MVLIPVLIWLIMMQTLRQYETGTTPKAGSRALHGSGATVPHHGLGAGGTSTTPHAGSGATPALLHGSHKAANGAGAPFAASGDTRFYWLECLANGDESHSGSDGGTGTLSRRPPMGAASGRDVPLMEKMRSGWRVIEQVCFFWLGMNLQDASSSPPIIVPACCSSWMMSPCHPSSSPHLQAASSSRQGARLLLLLDEPLSALGQALPMMMVMWAAKTMGPKVRPHTLIAGTVGDDWQGH